MLKDTTYIPARELLLSRTQTVGTERVSLLNCAGRILAQELRAEADVPAFDRSPYDGYAFRAADTVNASRENPVTLRILEEVPAGKTPTKEVTPGTATKVLTGAPVPVGADAVINFEATEFTDTAVTLFEPVKTGSNVIYAGEDVRKGTLLAGIGQVIDAGTAGTLAAQGVAEPLVYRVPKVAILSTGSELVEAGEPTAPGLIRNSNAYTIAAAVRAAGLEPVYLGIARDNLEAIAALFAKGLEECDAVISTGGVSVGDYDLTPAAVSSLGAELLIRNVLLKPGKACAFFVKDGKPICALSGNPASCVANYDTVALPAMRKLAGYRQPIPEEIEMTLRTDFPKKSKGTRAIRGTLLLENGKAMFEPSNGQGNVMLSGLIGCNALAIVPGGTGALEAGTVLKGFLV